MPYSKDEQKQIIAAMNLSAKHKIVLHNSIFLAVLIPVVAFLSYKFIPTLSPFLRINLPCLLLICLVTLHVQKKMKEADEEISEDSVHFIPVTDVTKPEDTEPGTYFVDVHSMDELNEFLQNVGMDTEQAEELKNMLGGIFTANQGEENNSHEKSN